MILKARRVLIGAVVVVVAGCLDLGGPKDGVVSISSLRLPYPSVVAGDLLRDSLGNPAPVSVIAYGPDGQELPTEPKTFVALDSSVRVDADGTVRGVTRDTLGGRIVGGAGALQTPPTRLIVTIAPTAVTKGADPTLIQFVAEAPDSTANTNWSSPLVVTVLGAGDAPAQGYVVVYSIIEMPDAVEAGTPTAYIAEGASPRMPRDTTNTLGIASRRVILRQSAVATDIRNGSRSDSVIVRATIKYLGADVPGSPVEFIVPVSRKP
jgi:hypothetical protein